MEKEMFNFLTEEDIKNEINSYQLIVNYIKENFKDGEDYGKIAEYPKPSLLKSGAEKLCSLLNLSVQVEILEKIEDFKEGIFHYVCKCTLKNSLGNIVSEGLGSCNSRESKFLNQNPYGVANTVLKLSKKRALVDAILTATRTSGMFTQDIEELDELISTNIKVNLATASQKAFIAKLAKDKGMSETQLMDFTKKVTGKEKSKDWTKDDAAKIIKTLKNK
ncbi:MAG: hypothetical protein JG776_1575 [Caloramator sp.]|jgi:hypothetical protein|uniref:hypothetical protein n=1 Tax=Caloramator sp. TaxID=1871330 RepID=UPI001D5F5608|nr:hypothetical protein [Caloramator sp.]MBZ4663860.1 hypothetical protein [Caloramator sp.]